MASPRKARLLDFCNRMALKKLRRCHTFHWCELCNLEIHTGQEYRGDRDGDRAHEDCLIAVRRAFRDPVRKAVDKESQHG